MKIALVHHAPALTIQPKRRRSALETLCLVLLVQFCEALIISLGVTALAGEIHDQGHLAHVFC